MKSELTFRGTYLVLTGLLMLPGQTLSQAASAPSSDNLLASRTDSVVHAAVTSFFKTGGKVGLSVGLYVRGAASFYNYGTERRGLARLPSRTSIYEIGSITKTFCGMVLAQAVTEGKVHLDDDIRRYLPEDYPNLEYRGHPIKLFHLLNHSSGLPFDFIDRTEYEGMNSDSLVFVLADRENSYPRAQFFRDLHTVRLDTIPGIRLSYSNAAAQLLSFILEQLYHQPFEELVSQYGTSPAEMESTAFHFPDSVRIVTGYNEHGLPVPHFSSGAAGGLYSTTEDLLKYGRLHLDEQNPVIALTHKPTWGQIQYYAMGLNWQMQHKENTYRRIWQSGGTGGFTGLVAVYPGADLVIVLLSNEHDRDSEGGLSMIDRDIVAGLTGN